MRILVTGGAGFIGSHLCERLLERGDDVICLDNFFTGRKQNVAAHLADPSFELVRHDVVEPIFLEVDQIYHLACPASPVHYQSNPVKTLKTNILGTHNMLGLAKRVRARFLLASTSEVYGDPQEHPQRESYWGHVNPHGTRSCYDEGKRAAESLVMDYHRQNGVDVRVVRIFNTYGPRMLPDDGRVVSNFIVQALSGDDLTVYGEGQQTRSFCYVDDLVDGLIRMMNSAGEPGPVNLGNPEETTVKELALRVMHKVATRSRIVHKPVPLDDPTRRRPDITLARTRLAWEPRVALDEGLDRTIAYFRGELS
jgi:UDP-glucuronate decarboxylase